jgi:O-antigen/teichoic acid export membrane protein
MRMLYHISAMGIRGLGLVAKFLLILCFVRYLQPSELGLYGIITAMVAYALFFLGLEFYNFASRILVDVSPLEQSLIIRDQLILYVIIFVILTPFFYGLFVQKMLPGSLSILFFLLLITEHLSNELMRDLVVLSKPYLANLVFFLRQGAWIMILVPAFYYLPITRTLHMVILSWIFGALLSIMLAGWGLRELPWSQVWQISIDWRRLVQGLMISRPFLVTAFCALSMLYIERFFINHYCGLDMLGIYTFYAGLSITLHSLINTGVSKMRMAFLLSAWKNNDMAEFHKESMRMLKETLAFVGLLAGLAVLLINPFMHLINKPMYLQHQSIFYVLLLAVSCRCIADVPLYRLYAQHRDRALLLINLLAFVMLVIGNALFVPIFGLLGAAISSVAASAVLLLYSSIIMIQQLSHAPKKQVLILNE